ncbi:MAG TPA: UDP-glucuronosyltransferase [Ruminiclostridium sp.]|nr:UDP-glucuronosyltransferase [Ruminiclostridium sp.]
MVKRTVTVLCSGFGLGLYIPGLLVKNRLLEKNVSAEVEVFENLITKDKRDNIQKSRKAYHSNFAVALMAARMSVDIRQSIDNIMVDRLLETWKKEERKDFIILSGHWLHIMDEYRSRIEPEPFNAEILYVDCDLPPSWKSLQQFKPDYNLNYKEVWLFDFENKRMRYHIPVSEQEPIPFSEREERFIIHGGGWGMGTYQGKIPELQEKGFPLDIVLYEIQEASRKKAYDRCFMVDSQWRAWEKNKAGCYEFPPLAEIIASKDPVFTNREEYHKLFDVTKNTRAIIGKPGAGTLMDSLSSATPMIMLEPFGEHEQKNTMFWEQMGYGITYNSWKESDFSLKILRELHENLVKGRKAALDYTEDYKLKNGL